MLFYESRKNHFGHSLRLKIYVNNINRTIYKNLILIKIK